MIRVLIADDHVIVRNGVKKLCELMGDVIVTGEAANGDEVLELLQVCQFDMVLLDLYMPGVNGIKLLERIRSYDAKLPILIYSMRNEPQLAKRALHAGANGYVTKGGRQDILMSAICKVASGERFIDPDIVESMVLGSGERSNLLLRQRLTDRELQIMMRLAEGKSVSRIAEELFVSTKTISTLKLRLMHKMKFKNIPELVLYAAEYGLIDK